MPRWTAFIAARHGASGRATASASTFGEHCRVAHVGGGAWRVAHSEFLVGDTRVVAMLLSRDVALQLDADGAESREVKFEEELLESVVVVRRHDKDDAELGIRMAGFVFETVDRIDPAGRAVVYDGHASQLRIVDLPRASRARPRSGLDWRTQVDRRAGQGSCRSSGTQPHTPHLRAPGEVSRCRDTATARRQRTRRAASRVDTPRAA